MGLATDGIDISFDEAAVHAVDPSLVSEDMSAWDFYNALGIGNLLPGGAAPAAAGGAVKGSDMSKKKIMGQGQAGVMGGSGGAAEGRRVSSAGEGGGTGGGQTAELLVVVDGNEVYASDEDADPDDPVEDARPVSKIESECIVTCWVTILWNS